MNRDLLTARIHTALNKELIKRLLVRYFSNKGFSENFNKKIYPPILQDILVHVPQLAGKIEVAPFVEEVDPNTGIVKLGWNLFVLGHKRIYIGESVHSNLIEVRMSIGGPLEGTSYKIGTATPKRIINFICSVLSKNKDGDITSIPKNVLLRTPSAMMANNDPGGFFRTNRRPVW
jgi:hypothetical protein